MGKKKTNKSKNKKEDVAKAAAEAAAAASTSALAEEEAASRERAAEEERSRALSAELCASRHPNVEWVEYVDERQLPEVMQLVDNDLSEPYSIFTYRYFINNWPQLCYLAVAGPDERVVGAIVCKQDAHRSGTQRGYLAMLAVHSSMRKCGMGRKLVTLFMHEMHRGGADEAVLETEVTNLGALRLYEGLGFVRDKRLHRYYLNGNDAYRLKLWFKDLVPGEVQPR